jgi:hypothetical protein
MIEQYDEGPSIGKIRSSTATSCRLLPVRSYPKQRGVSSIVAKHKFSGAHVAISTSLAAEQAASLAKTVGESTKGDLRIGLNHVRFEGAQAGRLNFSIRGPKDISELMSFHLTIESTPNSTAIRTRIDGFKTRQEKLFYLIPFGPKKLLGYKTYRRFMENLTSGVTSLDSRATITLAERP